MEPSPRPEIERALRFIADHLDEPIGVLDVAHAAHLSEFHLHRVFHSEVGESIGRFITRRRLELAALRLAYEPDRSITDIALSSGYSSGSNFSKAFAAHFGCSPTGVRAPKAEMPASVGRILSVYGKDFRAEDLYSLPPALSDEERKREAERWNACVRYENSPGMSFACVASPAGYDYDALLRTWTELVEWAQQLGLARGRDVDAWGMGLDSPQLTAPELCRYHACIPCPEDSPLPSGCFRGHMQAGRYAVFSYKGPIEGAADAYRSLYSCWFPESNLAPADFVPLDHYIGDFPQAGQIDYEIWLHVRPRRAIAS